MQFQPIHASRYLAVKDAQPMARIAPIEDGGAERILGVMHKAVRIGNSIWLSLLLLVICFIATLIFCGIAIDHKWISGWAVLFTFVIYAILLIGILWRMIAHPNAWSHRYIANAANRVIGARLDAIVSHRDPRAVLTEIVPRANIGAMKLEEAEDIGFMLIDPERREILYEGDSVRCRIPADAIGMLGILVERCPIQDQFYIELQIRAADRMHTISFRPRHSKSNHFKRTYDETFEEQFATIASWFPQVDPLENHPPLRYQQSEVAI